jgi:hypothetical protein
MDPAVIKTASPDCKSGIISLYDGPFKNKKSAENAAEPSKYIYFFLGAGQLPFPLPVLGPLPAGPVPSLLAI